MLYVSGQIYRHSHPVWGPVAPADIPDLDTRIMSTKIMSTKIISTGADERRQWPIAI
jgi:hypothetical protein